MKSTLRLLMVLALSANFFGCSTGQVNEDDPKALYDYANKDIENDRYQIALDKLRMLKNKFSYTNYGALAQLRIGDVYFLQESYPEASAAYETFVDLHPKHDKAGYAIFRAGESYFSDMPSNTERDLKAAEKTIQSMQQYMIRFPSGEYAVKAMEMKKQAYDLLAEKELDIAKFYLRREKYDAAMIRLKKVMDQYPESPSAIVAKEKFKEIPGTVQGQ